jgi:hypothetical protein
MKVKRKLYSAILVVSITIGACSKENTTTNDSGNLQNEKVGFELVEIESYSEILVWTNDEPMTMSQFDSIQIPSNWRKNEPREGDPDESKFLRSPDAAADGVFTRDEHFGYNWLFILILLQQSRFFSGACTAISLRRRIGQYLCVEFSCRILRERIRAGARGNDLSTSGVQNGLPKQKLHLLPKFTEHIQRILQAAF